MAALSAVTLALLVLMVSLPGRAGTGAPRPGQPAPDFTLGLLDGGQISLAELAGKAVVLNFWATWCPPCRQEMPLLEDAQQRYQNQGLVVLGINLSESAVAVRAFRERTGLTFPIALDTEGKVTELYGIIPLPTTYFIGRDGRVVSKVEGQLDPNHLQTEIGKLLAGTSAPPEEETPERGPEFRGAPASGGGSVRP